MSGPSFTASSGRCEHSGSDMRVSAMNDEFLHRVRKAPAPDFLKELKSRLDRQPPLGRMPSPRRRWTFTRGLLAGLLLGGAAFAFLARLLPGPQQEPPQVQRRDVV